MMESKQLVTEKKNLSILFCSMILILFAVGFTDAAEKNPSSSYEDKLLSHINQYRLQNGLNLLSFDKALQKSAKMHSRHMESTDTLTHRGFDERYKQCGRLLCVENVGWNYMMPEGLFQAWKNSGGHNENMLNKRIKYAGISKIGPYVTFFACD
jgi:uncharacterized protein YkwD